MRYSQERGYTPLAASLDRDAAYAGFAPINRSVMPPPITTPWVRFGPAVRVMSAGCTTCPGSTVEGHMGIRDGLQGLGAVPAGGYVGAIGRTMGVGAIGRVMGPPHRSGAHIRHAMTFAALSSAGVGSTETDVCTALSAGASILTLVEQACPCGRGQSTGPLAKANYVAPAAGSTECMACKITMTVVATGIAAACGAVNAAAAREAQRRAAAAQAQLDAGNAAAAQAQLDAAHAAADQSKAFTPQASPATNYVPILAAGALALGVAWFIFK